MLQPPEAFLLEITDIAFGGDGVGRHEGMAVFVPFAAMGDRLKVSILEKRKNFIRAQILEILTPGPGRTEPRCSYFRMCGGCQYQHLDYPTQLAAKEHQVRSSLKRIGKLEQPPVLPIIRSTEPYAYRNRISVHAAQGVVGFHTLDGHTLLDVENCSIASDEVNEALTHLRSRNPMEGHFSLREAALPRSGFHQSNRFLLETLRQEVVKAVGAGGEFLFEGYCGGGFFTEAIAGQFKRVVACDHDPRTLSHVPRLLNVDWRQADAVDAMREIEPDMVLLDPPREGLPSLLASLLTQKRIHKVIYVSCDPATLARDVARLSSTFMLETVQPLDLFPQTAHIECVAVFIRRC